MKSAQYISCNQFGSSYTRPLRRWILYIPLLSQIERLLMTLKVNWASISYDWHNVWLLYRTQSQIESHVDKLDDRLTLNRLHKSMLRRYQHILCTVRVSSGFIIRGAISVFVFSNQTCWRSCWVECDSQKERDKSKTRKTTMAIHDECYS